MRSKADKISEAEAEIMRVVWDQGGPVPYSHIRTVLAEQKGLKSPTVNTLVNRLVKKGVLTQEKREVYYYVPLVSEEEYTKEKTQSFIEKVYGGNVKGLMTALLSYGDMSREELEELREQWRREGEKHE